MLCRVAIDGPSGAGKSSVAKAVAKELEILYVDTGALYRAVAYIAKTNGLENNLPALLDLLYKSEIGYQEGQIAVDGRVVESKIRTEEVSRLSSQLSREKEIRAFLLSIQQELAKANSLVMEGRDIGSVVMPEAEFKFYLTADAKIRSQRRYDQLIAKGEKADLDQVYKEILERDTRDKTRKIAPLLMVDEAICIDSGKMSQNQVVRAIVGRIKGSGHAL